MRAHWAIRKGGLVEDSGQSGAIPEGSMAADLEVLRARVLFLEREAHRRQLAEDALKQSEERYRILVDSMNEGLGVLDDSGSIVYINDKFARMLGRERQELLGQSILDFVQPQQRDLFPLAATPGAARASSTSSGKTASPSPRWSPPPRSTVRRAKSAAVSPSSQTSLKSKRPKKRSPKSATSSECSWTASPTIST